MKRIKELETLEQLVELEALLRWWTEHYKEDLADAVIGLVQCQIELLRERVGKTQ